jgi:hypothetical protein
MPFGSTNSQLAFFAFVIVLLGFFIFVVPVLTLYVRNVGKSRLTLFNWSEWQSALASPNINLFRLASIGCFVIAFVLGMMALWNALASE